MDEHQLRRIIRQEINSAHWGTLWRTEQLLRALVRHQGMNVAGVLRAARKHRAARRKGK